MHDKKATPVYLLIAGVNKAGTTSVFQYLSSHPDVCGSAVKETKFFAVDWTGEPEHDHNNAREKGDDEADHGQDLQEKHGITSPAALLSSPVRAEGYRQLWRPPFSSPEGIPPGA